MRRHRRSSSSRTPSARPGGPDTAAASDADPPRGTRDQLVEGERLLDPRRVVVPAVRSSPGDAPYRVLRSRVAPLLRPGR